MYSQERIRLMTKAALYDEKEKRRDLYICRFFRPDYMAFYLFKTILCVTAAYGLLVAAAAIYWIEVGMQRLQDMPWQLLLFTVLLVYIVFLFVFVVIALIVYSLRYERATKTVKKHLQNLRALERLYREEAMRTSVNTSLGSAKKIIITSDSEGE